MKLFVLFSIVCLLFIVPTTFAVEDGNVTLESYDNSQVLTTDYYFDANVDNDSGDGSIDHPYKELTSQRIVDNSNIYLASGNYSLDMNKNIRNVTIVGANAKDTILKFHGPGFTVSGSLTLNDLTLNNLIITNKGTLNATNVIFNNNLKQTKGGAILCENSGSCINLNDCTFVNSSAQYGGAIYISKGTLNINNSLFMGTTSDLFGGAISAVDKAVVNIQNSKFSSTRSKSDAGGAIYLLKSSLYGVNLEIYNSTADFGGAITSLQSTLDLNNFTGRNNKAKYDGGAIYAMYRSFTIINSLLKSNQAQNGGAIYADDVESFIINSNRFISNTASSTAGGVYSLKSDCYYDSILDKELNNTFSNNRASSNDDVYESNLPDVTVGSADYQWIRLNSTSYNGTLPVSYDLRILGQVTPVKNQGSNGNCWAFSAIGALESAILKASGIECDLSEENMKNIMGTYSYYGWSERGIETNNGGFDRMAYAYFIGWLGPVNESDDSYKINSVISPVLDSIFHIQNVLFFKRENYTDNDEIKRAIMEYGGLSTVLYMSATSKNYKQYYNGSEYSDHAAVIVGWDDEMEIPNAPDKGAWIVKNSWGDDWGDKGYFYVSYYDARFAEPGDYDTFAIVLNDTIRYDKNYQYDVSGFTDYYLNASSTVWYKNRFKATDNEYLAGVSTYFEKDTEWEVSIYVNGKLKHTQSGVATHSYRTIDLNQRIALKKGDEFEVVFKITVDKEAGFPICEPVSLSQANFTANLSFVSYDGKNWVDLITKTGDYSTHTYHGYQIACVKAFTILNKINTALSLEVVDSYNPAQFKATVKDQYGNLLKTGKVTFTVEGESITVDVTDGIALLTYSFATVGSKTVTAKFTANGYNPSQKSITKTIYPSKLSIGLTITTNVLDAEIGIKLSKDVDVTVYLNVDGNVSAVNVKNGVGKLSLKNLDYGTHTVKAYVTSEAYTCQNVSKSFKINYISTAIKVSNVEMTYKQNYTFTLTLLDKSSNAVSDKTVVVNLNNKKYSLKTDSNGNAVIPTADLIPGTYTADITFAGRGIYLASNASAQVVVNKLSTAITASSIVANYNGGKSFYAYLKDANGDAISAAKLNVVIGNISKTLTTNANGRVSLSVDGLVPKNYTAAVTFAGNQLYTKSGITSKVTINKINPNLTAVDVVEDYNGGKEVVATLNDMYNNPIVGAKISIALNGVKSTLTTDSYGKVHVSTDSLVPNTYVANITFLGNDIYKKFSITSRVVVNKRSTVLTAPRVNATYSSGKSIVVTLKDTNGKAINGVNVKVTLNSVTRTMTTNSNGQVSLSLDDLVPNVYAAGITFSGNKIYNPTSTTTNISINKADSNAVVKYSSGNLVATLKDPNGKAISGARIAFVIGSSKNYAVTDANGQATYSTASLADGSYTAKVGFFGNDLYKSSNQPTVKFTVARIATKLTVNNVAATYKSGKYVLAVLKDVNNNAVSGAKIAFVVNGKSTYLTTDARGCARYSTDSFKEGSYDVKVGFFGNSIYKSSNQAVSKVVISRIVTKLAVNNVATTYKSGKYILAVLKDASGKAIKGAKVCFVVNSKGNYVITDANGRATYSTDNFAEGSYDVKVAFFGNDTYKPSNQAVSKVVISKMATSLAVNNVAAKYKSGKYILALLKDASGKAIKGAKVCFVVNGKSNYVVTDINGKARLSIDSFAVGSYSVKVGYFGNSTYKASNQAISKVTISR